MVLVDRSPIVEERGEAWVRNPIERLGDLSLVGEVEHVDGTVLHGTYSGLLNGSAVVMDQFVRMCNCVPRTIVYVISRVHGPEQPVSVAQEEILGRFLGVEQTEERHGATVG